MSKQAANRPPTSRAITALLFAVLGIVLLGAASALLGLGSAPFIGKWGNVDLKTISVGLVLVIEGVIFLSKLVKLLPAGSWGSTLIPQQASNALLMGDTPANGPPNRAPVVTARTPTGSDDAPPAEPG